MLSKLREHLLGTSLGLIDEPRPCTPHDLVEPFGWDRMPRTDWPLPRHFVQRLKAMS